MDVTRIEALLRLVQESVVSEVEVAAEGWRVGIRRGRAASTTSQVAVQDRSAEEAVGAVRHAISAGLVGRFRSAEPPLSTGDRVEAGQIVGSIESMGILNPVAAPEGGQVIGVHVQDDHAVEFGQELFELSPPADTAGGRAGGSE